LKHGSSVFSRSAGAEILTEAITLSKTHRIDLQKKTHRIDKKKEEQVL
jgi:hypothetical protein